MAAAPAVGVGGAVGALARYGVARAVTVRSGGFPIATFMVNVSGSLALGVVLVVVLELVPGPRAKFARSLLATGFLGAYTTFSTFALDSDLLVRDGHVVTALIYIASSLVAGLAAVGIGIGAARLVGRHLGRAQRRSPC